MGMSESSINLYDLDREGLEALMKDLGQPAFRAKQVFHQLYGNLVESIDEMTDLPAALREELGRRCCLGNLSLKKVQKGDGGLTRKALFELPGKEGVEELRVTAEYARQRFDESDKGQLKVAS